MQVTNWCTLGPTQRAKLRSVTQQSVWWPDMNLVNHLSPLTTFKFQYVKTLSTQGDPQLVALYRSAAASPLAQSYGWQILVRQGEMKPSPGVKVLNLSFIEQTLTLRTLSGEMVISKTVGGDEVLKDVVAAMLRSIPDYDLRSVRIIIGLQVLTCTHRTWTIRPCFLSYA